MNTTFSRKRLLKGCCFHIATNKKAEHKYLIDCLIGQETVLKLDQRGSKLFTLENESLCFEEPPIFSLACVCNRTTCCF